MFLEALDMSLGLLLYESIVDFEHVFEIKTKISILVVAMMSSKPVKCFTLISVERNRSIKQMW